VRAVEAWLKSDDPEKFAEAAVKCEHTGAFCMEDGFCHFEGRCFRTGRSTVTAAMRSIERAADNEPADIALEMRRAAKLLREVADAEQSIVERNAE
jgi:hypothetical protein